MLEFKPPLTEEFNEVFKPLRHNLSSISIRRGLTDSNVYTDYDLSWIVTRVNSRILVSGDYTQPEALKAVQLVVDTGIESGRRGFVIYYPSNVEKAGIGEHIQSVKPYPNQRNYYVLETGKNVYPVSLLDGYRIERVSKEFLEKGYQNTDLVIEEMQSERASVDGFLEKSFSFCALYGDFIAAWCMSEYNADGGFEIGIETHKDHRQKGLAVQVARTCINHGIEEGYRYVGWHCWKRNEASNRTALRLGFKHVLEYPVEYLEAE